MKTSRGIVRMRWAQVGLRLAVAGTLLLGAVGALAQSPEDSSSGPRVFSLDVKVLEALKKSVDSDGRTTNRGLHAWLSQAQKCLNQTPLSVTYKSQTPPSGDKHDFLAIGRYYWPNPKTANGLPYVTRDGQTSPEYRKYHDPDYLNAMIDCVQALGLAYYLRGDETYAQKAAQLLRVWFLDPQTRMKPNLNYAEIRPGTSEANPYGIIHARGMVQLVDAIGLLAGSKSWTREDQAGMQAWCTQYLDWLVGNSLGQKEAEATNNHGTWYDAQVVALALFVGQTDRARKVIEEAKARRIDKQIAPDGRQPRELSRTLSFGYSIFNLEALFALERLGHNVGIALCDYTSPDGRSIRKAVDFLIPYIRGQKVWSYSQLTPVQYGETYALVYRAARACGDADYAQLAATIKGDNRSRPPLDLLDPTS